MSEKGQKRIDLALVFIEMERDGRRLGLTRFWELAGRVHSGGPNGTPRGFRGAFPRVSPGAIFASSLRDQATVAMPWDGKGTTATPWSEAEVFDGP